MMKLLRRQPLSTEFGFVLRAHFARVDKARLTRRGAEAQRRKGAVALADVQSRHLTGMETPRMMDLFIRQNPPIAIVAVEFTLVRSSSLTYL